MSVGCINSDISSRREYPKNYKCKTLTHTHTHTLSLSPRREAFQLDFKSHGLQGYQGRAVGAAVTIPEEITMAMRAIKMLYWIHHWKCFFVRKNS